VASAVEKIKNPHATPDSIAAAIEFLGAEGNMDSTRQAHAQLVPALLSLIDKFRVAGQQMLVLQGLTLLGKVLDAEPKSAAVASSAMGVQVVVTCCKQYTTGETGIPTAALHALAALTPDNKETLATAGGVAAVLELMKINPRSAQIQGEGARVLWNARGHAGVNAELLRQNAKAVLPSAFTAALSDENAGHYVVLALCTLISADESMRKAVAEDMDGVVNAVVEGGKRWTRLEGTCNTFLECINRDQSENVQAAQTQGVCTLLLCQKCPIGEDPSARCPAYDGTYCPQCSIAQWFAVCTQCDSANSKKFYCEQCIRVHHTGHAVSKPFFLPGHCSCIAKDCKKVKAPVTATSAAASAASGTSTSPAPMPPPKTGLSPMMVDPQGPSAKGNPIALLHGVLQMNPCTMGWQEHPAKDFLFCNVQQGSTLWNKILELWNRRPAGCPNRPYTVTRAHLVWNDMLAPAFISCARKLEMRRGGDSAQMFHFAAKDADQVTVLTRLRNIFIPQTQYKKTNFVFLFHGCAPNTATQICRGGLADLRRTDGGFFGSGVYLTPEAQYAALYASALNPKIQPTEFGEFSVIMAASAIGLAYPITRKDYNFPAENAMYSISSYHCAFPIKQEAITQYNGGQRQQILVELSKREDKALKPAFDAHFIGINASKWKYQACPPAEIEYDEIVIKEESQVLPIAIIYFKNAK
jgi:hypothetical protein